MIPFSGGRNSSLLNKSGTSATGDVLKQQNLKSPSQNTLAFKASEKGKLVTNF